MKVPCDQSSLSTFKDELWQPHFLQNPFQMTDISFFISSAILNLLEQYISTTVQKPAISVMIAEGIGCRYIANNIWWSRM